MKLVNRSALALVPKQPLADWVGGLDSEISGLEQPMTLGDHRREGRVYLLEEIQEAAESDVLVARYWLSIFENELGAWDEFGDHWPSPLTRALFDEWFEIQPQMLCFDAAAEPMMLADLNDL